MKLDYYMNAKDWKDLLNYLSARGCNLVYFPTTDSNGLFVDFKYALVEYGGMFFYMQAGDWKFTVTPYHKVSAYEKQQNGYPREVQTAEDLLEFIKTQKKDKPLSKTYKQRIFLNELYTMKDGHTALWHLENTLAGNREKDILSTLVLITTIQHTHDYHVLRFHSIDGKHFDYEVRSKRITG